MLQALAARQTELTKAYRYSSARPKPENLAVTVPPQLHSLMSTVAWSQALCRALEERIELKDVTLPGDEVLTTDLRRWVEDGDLREAMSQAHEEALRTGVGYVIASAHPELPDTPLFTAESPSSFYAQTDPRTGKVLWAIRSYKADPSQPAYNIDGHDRVTVYLPNVTRYLIRKEGRWVSDPEIPDVQHNLGEPPVEALVNRRTRRNPFGTPEHEPLWDLQDAAARTLTSLQIAQEFAAIPQKVILNADQEDFDGDEEEGIEPVTQTDLILKRYLVLTGDAKIGEYSAAQLQNYTTSLNSLARQASAVSGLPLDFLGVASDANPSSGDAIRGSNDRLVRRAQRFARGLTPAWVRLLAKGARVIGFRRDDLARIQLTWADPGTVTPSAMADAAQKLAGIRTAEGPLFTRDYLWKYLDVDPEDREEMRTSLQQDSFVNLLADFDTTEEDTDNGESSDTE